MAPPAVAEDAGVSIERDAGGMIGGEDAGTMEPPPVSFAQDIVPIFARTCGAGVMNCHIRDAYRAWSDRDCRGWLSLEDAPLGATYAGDATGCPDRSLYQRLTELDAWMCDPVRKYIVPGDLDGSQLYAVISGNAARGGECMKAPNMPLESMPPATSTLRLSATHMPEKLPVHSSQYSPIPRASRVAQMCGLTSSPGARLRAHAGVAAARFAPRT